MQTFIAGSDALVKIAFVRDDEPFVPAGGTISYELRGHDGVVLASGSKTGVVDSSTTITIAAIHNALSGARKREKRTLVIRADDETFNVVYRLTGFLNLGVTASDVRKYAGLTAGELPDADIDLVTAFFNVADLSSTETLELALAGDEKKERAANQAVLCQALLDVLPGLQLRIAKSETDGSLETERFDVDLDKLEKRAMRDLAKAVSTVSGATISTADARLVFGQRTDPLTGN